MNKKQNRGEKTRAKRTNSRRCAVRTGSPSSVLKAVAAAEAAHVKMAHRLTTWGRLRKEEYSTIVCAALAAFQDAPESFVIGMMQAEQMENNRGQTMAPHAPTQGEPS